MSDARVLIVFTTVAGHTRSVATHLAKAFTDAGFGAVLSDLHRVTEPLETDDLDGVVLVGPVRFGRHPRRLRRFARRNREALRRTESAFVSVSGAAMVDDPESREEARGYAERFVESTGWEPDRTLCLGGAVTYTRYNPILRRVMRSISAKRGLSTDTSRDHVYTDWKAADAFVEEFGRRVAKHRVARTRASVPRRRPASESHATSPGEGS